MSGHSKWSTIKHKKAAADAKRGQSFTKITRMITLAVKKSQSGDPDSNPALRLAMDKAREVNMPKENVQRAIDRGLGKGTEGRVEEVTYEGYGPGGVGIIVQLLTDNRNRTAAEIKNIFERLGGNLGGPGSVSYLKQIQPTPMIGLSGAEKGKVEQLLQALDEHDDVVEVWSNLQS